VRVVARKQLKNLTEPMYYILLILTTPNHGYGIMQRVEEMTEGHVIIGAGTLYTLLSRFENEGIIKVVSQEDRKKNYVITEKGRDLLEEEFQRLNRLIQDGERLLGGGS